MTIDQLILCALGFWLFVLTIYAMAGIHTIEFNSEVFHRSIHRDVRDLFDRVSKIETVSDVETDDLPSADSQLKFAQKEIKRLQGFLVIYRELAMKKWGTL